LFYNFKYKTDFEWKRLSLLFTAKIGFGRTWFRTFILGVRPKPFFYKSVRHRRQTKWWLYRSDNMYRRYEFLELYKA